MKTNPNGAGLPGSFFASAVSSLRSKYAKSVKKGGNTPTAVSSNSMPTPIKSVGTRKGPSASKAAISRSKGTSSKVRSKSTVGSHKLARAKGKATPNGYSKKNGLGKNQAKWNGIKKK